MGDGLFFVFLVLTVFIRNKNNTFRPKKKIPKDTKHYEMHKYAKATLGSGNLKAAVQLPPKENEDDWLAVNSFVSFFFLFHFFVVVLARILCNFFFLRGGAPPLKCFFFLSFFFFLFFFFFFFLFSFFFFLFFSFLLSVWVLALVLVLINSPSQLLISSTKLIFCMEVLRSFVLSNLAQSCPLATSMPSLFSSLLFSY